MALIMKHSFHSFIFSFRVDNNDVIKPEVTRPRPRPRVIRPRPRPRPQVIKPRPSFPSPFLICGFSYIVGSDHGFMFV